MQFWLVKTEPETFSWEDHVREGVSVWNGVRNFAARNHLRQMALEDRVLFYNSGKDRAIVGISKVVRTAYPDPTATEGDWSAVDLSPLKLLSRPVSLSAIKENPELQQMALIRISRLSVQPVTAGEYEMVLNLGGESIYG